MTWLDTLDALYEASIWLALIAITWSVSTRIWGTK